MQARRVFLVSMALLTLALLVSPALAAKPVYHWAWNWQGTTFVTGDPSPGLIEVDGSSILLSGTTALTAEGATRGTGVFIDRTQGLKAKLDISYGYFGTLDGNSIFGPAGTADVTVNDVYKGTYTFALWVVTLPDSEKAWGLNLGLTDYPDDGLFTSWSLNQDAGDGIGGAGLHPL